MGVDACIFAMQSKKYFYFDRLSNIEKYWDMQHGEYDECSLTYDLLRKKKGTSYLKTLKFLELTLAIWLKKEAAKEVEPHSGWIVDMIKFVKAHPQDEFMVVTDHDDPPSWGYQAGTYSRKYHPELPEHEEWKPNG